jgi:hypothetical protein
VRVPLGARRRNGAHPSTSPNVYSTCLFCHASLGHNESIEVFPVGRRIAFDAQKGRLWVVCRRCDRWNLTSLEERWEAIEQSERMFRETRLRVSTDNIGLGRVAEGLELVRIGRALRPELAAWRYGDQFGRRRRRVVVAGSVALGTSVVFAAALPVLGAASAVFGVSYLTAMGVGAAVRGLMFRSRWVSDGTGEHVLVTPSEVPHIRLAAGSEHGWALRVPYQSRGRPDEWRKWINVVPPGEVTLTGPDALEAARRLLPLVNGTGAPAGAVRDAVSALEEWGGPERAFTAAVARVREWSREQTFGDTGALRFLPRAARLALEMAAHEEQERRVLEGELADLERQWRDAEEIAAIADDLLLPDSARRWIERVRRGS